MKKKTVVPTMSVRGHKIYTKAKKEGCGGCLTFFSLANGNAIFYCYFFHLRKAGLKNWDWELKSVTQGVKGL